MLDWIIQPLSLTFMQRALMLGILLGILCAIVGSYMIVQQMGMLAHAISHSVMAGLPIAYVVGVALSFGALIAGVISALVLYLIESRSRVKTDAAMALILTSFVGKSDVTNEKLIFFVHLCIIEYIIYSAFDEQLDTLFSWKLENFSKILPTICRIF